MTIAFAKAVEESISIAGVIRALGRSITGSNYRFVRREVVRLDLNTSHWKGQAHGTSPQERVPWAEVLVENSRHPINRRRKRSLIREGFLKNKCAICECPPEWNGKPLVLRLDHQNGVRNDNRVENLRLVCPNCDSQLETYCGRNKAPVGQRLAGTL